DFCNPISFQKTLNESFNGARAGSPFLRYTLFLMTIYAGIHLSVAVICFLIARWQLRLRATSGLFSWVSRVTVRVSRKQTAEGVKIVRKPLRMHVHKPLTGNNPLLWKECHVGRTWFGKTILDFGILVYVLFGLVVPTLASVMNLGILNEAV